MENNKLYVGNMSWNTDEAGLRAAFEAFGSVQEVAIITDRDTGRPRGFGFVTMSSDEEASEAVSAMDGQQLDGRALRVNIAESRRGGGGGGRRERNRW
ncbi:MAG: RNA-binding protein [Deltaproteobacteria bacterium]